MSVQSLSYRTWWSPYGWQRRLESRWTEPSYWHDPAFNAPNQPVVGVSWYEAIAYCSWISAQLGYAVRLPYELEWEKAARGTDGRTFPWGKCWSKIYANTHNLQFGQPAPVGLFPQGRSPFGLDDMAGNVWEWTQTLFINNHLVPQQNPADRARIDTGSWASIRGGSWFYDFLFTRTFFREGTLPGCRDNDYGFRVVAPERRPEDDTVSKEASIGTVILIASLESPFALVRNNR